MKVKDFIENLKQDYKDDDEILFIYWDKKLCREWVKDSLSDLAYEHKLSDEQVDDMFNSAWEYVSNDSYETEDVGEAIEYSLNESFTEWLKDAK